jgi:DNA repair protein RadC
MGKVEFPSEYKSIKSWAEEDKPREKLILKGKGALTDSELIAILLGSGTRTKSAVELAKEVLLKEDQSLVELGKRSIKELQQHKGIGIAKAVTIVAALELGRRRRFQELPKKIKVKEASQVFEFMHPTIGDLHHEQFWVIFISQSLHIVGKKLIGSGGVTATVADVKLIFKAALEQAVPNIIICHNHPSGNLKASQADIKITQKVKSAGENLDINLLDHLIITNKAYFSFVEEGLL